MALTSTAPLVILLISVLLLMPPLDKGVILGDFEPVHTQKVNPLSDPSILVEDIFFPSQGETCHAWLYLPPPPPTPPIQEDGEPIPEAPTIPPRPVVVMASGFGSQKDMGLDRYAERFIQDGFAVFMFDYRNFGSSTGTPRNLVSPKRHIEDYHTALDYIESIPESLKGKIDASKILLWGTSFSGGHVLEILSERATDANILGAVSQVPHLSGRLAAKIGIQKRGLVKMARLALAALQDKAREMVNLPPINAKVIGSGDDLALMSVTPEDHARYIAKQSKQKLGGWLNQTPARVLLEIRFYNPIDTLKKQHEDPSMSIKVPVLFISASLDDLTPPDIIEEANRLVKNSKLIVREGTHFEIYEPHNWVEVAEEMAKFYNECTAL